MQVATVTAVTGAVIGAVVAGLLAATAAGYGEPWSAGRALRQWALWSAVSLPVAFVFGSVAFVIGRSVWQGRKRAAGGSARPGV